MRVSIIMPLEGYSGDGFFRMEWSRGGTEFGIGVGLVDMPNKCVFRMKKSPTLWFGVLMDYIDKTDHVKVKCRTGEYIQFEMSGADLTERILAKAKPDGSFQAWQGDKLLTLVHDIGGSDAD